MKRLDFDRAAPVYFLEHCASTNTLMKELARDAEPEGSVIIAARQSRGRGRMGRSFVSPEGGVYMSMLLRPDTAAERLPQLGAVAALAVRRALASFCSVSADIKWPNDLLFEGKKLCGILTEGLLGESLAVILGIGVNLNSAIPPELADIAVSVRELCGREFDSLGFARCLVSELDTLCAMWQGGHSFREEYRAACTGLGQDVILIQNAVTQSAHALDIGEDMSLIVRLPDGKTRHIRWGELSLRF